jgi:hypothetical protein
VVAGSALGGHILHAIEAAHSRGHPPRAHLARATRQRAAPVSGSTKLSSAPTTQSSGSPTARSRPRHGLPVPPSKSLGYLAVGSPAAPSRSSSAPPESGTGSSPARAASVTSPPTGPEGSAPSAQPPAPAAKSGGGTTLGYLGR